MTEAARTQANNPEKTGLAYWMDRVLEEHSKSGDDLSAESVHDLRVALRRCTLIAGVMKDLDPDGDWKQMRKAARRLFRPLGAFRDAQVQMECLEEFGAAGKSPAAELLKELNARIERDRAAVRDAIGKFDRKQWRAWTRQLSGHFRHVASEKPACKSVALDLWDEIRELRRRAQKTQSRIAYHRLRVGIKKFRYAVENFLPALYPGWAPDLKSLQDLLGEIHDLDVLSRMIVKNKRLFDEASRSQWAGKIAERRQPLLQKFREKMAGKTSAIWSWREGLPGERELKSAGLARLAVWAYFLTPDFANARRVARLALQLYDGCANCGLIGKDQSFEERFVLHAAALLQEVGRSRKHKAHHKESYRMICRTAVPAGWSRRELTLAALVARFHRRALPRPDHKILQAYPLPVRQSLILLSALLRMANAFSAKAYRSVRRLEVENCSGVIVVRADGYSESDPMASKLTIARHLMEFACHHPVHILPPTARILGPQLVTPASHSDAA
jgi:CHAD domain-containing protein